MTRTVVLIVAALLVGLLGFLTMRQLFLTGPDVLVVISLGVLAVMGLGIFGALTEKR
jgi:hypothetical protein